MAILLFLLLLMLLLLGAVTYGAFKGNLGRVVSLLGVLVLLLILLSIANLRMSEPKVVTGEENTLGVRPLMSTKIDEDTQFLSSHPVSTTGDATAKVASRSHHVDTSTRVGIAVLPVLVLIVLGVFLVIKVLGAISTRQQQVPYEEQEPHRQQRFHWGWAFGGASVLFLLAVFCSYLLSYQVRDVANIGDPRPLFVADPAPQSATNHVKDFANANHQDRPTAELWEELTKSRIDLDGDSGESVKASHDSKNSEEADSDAEDVQDLPLPKWVKTKPKPIGNVYKVVVASDPFSTEDECFDQLEGMFDEQVRERLKKILPADQRAKVHGASLSEIGIPISYVMREVCRESYTEIQDRSFGAMKSVHVLMEFDASVEQELRSRWINYQRRQGLGFVSKMAALVLSALAICYSLLQIDTWTRGYYSKRLLVGLPVAIIAVALLVFS